MAARGARGRYKSYQYKNGAAPRAYTAEEVRAWRKRLVGPNAIKQKQLAEELGIHPGTLSRLLTEEANGELP